jgi:hypothetical protein
MKQSDISTHPVRYNHATFEEEPMTKREAIDVAD